MDQQQERKDHIARATKSRSLAQARRDLQAAAIDGKQAQLKREAEQRRQKRLKGQ